MIKKVIGFIFAGLSVAPVMNSPVISADIPYTIPLTIINKSTADIKCSVSIGNYTPPSACPGFDIQPMELVNAKSSRVYKLNCIAKAPNERIGPSIVQVSCDVHDLYPYTGNRNYQINGLYSLDTPIVFTPIPDPNNSYIIKGTLTQQRN